MTGPEHYRMAERLLERGASEGSGFMPNHIAAAQVHATLAAAAAFALRPLQPLAYTTKIGEAWRAVAS
jgi:hypothetical protein